MKEIAATSKSKLPMKYASELHCNEVMLLPYYIASMNIEHEYYSQTKEYKPFDGICLVDTFELAEPAQTTMFSTENTERVEKQKRAPIFVIVGNPPYNAGQADENDNNKIRKYPVVDKRVAQTYGKSSNATLLKKLSDPYVKAFRFASDRVGKEGIVCFVSNNSYLEDGSFDGMRLRLQDEFDAIYLLDLGGNVRRNPKLSGTANNVFGIQVGVVIGLMIKGGLSKSKIGKRVQYFRFEEYARRTERLALLTKLRSVSEVEWTDLTVGEDAKWLRSVNDDEFDNLVELGSKEAKGGQRTYSIFGTYTLGVSTNRDATVYDFSGIKLRTRIDDFVRIYNGEVRKYTEAGAPKDVDAFVSYEGIQWSDTLKHYLRRGTRLEVKSAHYVSALYRPFTQKILCYGRIFNDRPGQFRHIFPTADGPTNIVICATCHSQSPFSIIASSTIPSLDVGGRPTQCFPLYTYDEDGSNRRENITDWALNEFRTRIGEGKTRHKGKDHRKKRQTKFPRHRTPARGHRLPQQMGHLPLRLRLAAPARIPYEICSQSPARTSTHSDP
jgi:predicted helicase